MMSKLDEQHEAIAYAVRYALEHMGLEGIRSGEFFGMKQTRPKAGPLHLQPIDI